MTTSLSAITTFGIGYYIEWRGFTDLFWIGLGLQLLSILIIFLFFKSPTTPVITPLLSDETNSLLPSSICTVNVGIREGSSMTRFSYCFDILKIFRYNNRPRKKFVCLLLTLFAYVFCLFASSWVAPYIWYLLGTPFCWSSKDIGNYGAFASIIYAVFSILGMKLLTCVGASDALICAISHIFFSVFLLSIAFAQHSWQLYVGLLISPFSQYQTTLTLPMISKLLESNEREIGFTLIAEIKIVITSFGSSFFNWIYERTVISQKNFSMLLASGLSLVPLILNM
jgi:hypothetical protein